MKTIAAGHRLHGPDGAGTCSRRTGVTVEPRHTDIFQRSFIDISGTEILYKWIGEKCREKLNPSAFQVSTYFFQVQVSTNFFHGIPLTDADTLEADIDGLHKYGGSLLPQDTSSHQDTARQNQQQTNGMRSFLFRMHRNA